MTEKETKYTEKEIFDIIDSWRNNEVEMNWCSRKKDYDTHECCGQDGADISFTKKCFEGLFIKLKQKFMTAKGFRKAIEKSGLVGEKYMLKITIPFKTPTINHLFWHKGNIKIMKTEAKKLREEIKKIVLKDISFVCPNLNDGLKVIVEIHEDWFCKNGSVKRKDIANREKFLTDSVFDALNIDDKYIFEHIMKKIQSNEEKAVIKIEELNEK